jgi:Tfp pilus assembly protein PilX
MNQPQNPNQKFLQLMLRAQYLARHDARSERGYAMVVVSIISIFMFSLLVAYMTITNLTKSSTNAYIDGSNSFYAAESGLNKRAQQLREKFVGYTLPSAGSASVPSNVSECFPILTTATVSLNDFECRNYQFTYNNNIANAKNSDGNIVISEGNGNRNSINYIAHTFVVDRTNYKDTTNKSLGPDPTRISAGQAYAGLNAQEYKYTVYSTAKKPNAVEFDATQSAAMNAERAAKNSGVNTVLQMDFNVRVVPIFQFGMFYNNDLDFSPYTQMDIYGRVHTNKTLTINSHDTDGLRFAGGNTGTTNDHLNYAITAVGDIYTKDLANQGSPNGPNYIVMPGGSESITLSDGRAVQANKLLNQKDTPLNNDASAPADYKLDNFKPYLLNYLSSTPVQPLRLPPLGFLRKTDSTGNIGEYYGKADLRLMMRFDRAIPFDLTVIQTGAADGSTCAGMNIPSDRVGRNTAACSVANKGLLKSLMQPVLVLTKNNTDERDRFCKQSIPVRTSDTTIDNYNLNSIDLVTAASALNSLSDPNKDKILRALQVAISATSNRVSYENVTTTGVLPATEQTNFKNLLDRLKTTNPSDTALQTALSNTTTIAALPPATIAAIRSSCFLPAPIQKLDTSGSNPFDMRENRAMKLLQANIESLTVWNRDGVFVNFDTDLTTAGTASTANIEAAFDDAIATTPTTYSTNNLLFVRAEVSTNTTSNYMKLGYHSLPAQSFQKLGLGAVDRTEGGLALHATLDDTDFPIDTADNKRRYGTLKSQSPFGLVVNGGKNLPGPFTFASDQAIYIQGDYNNLDYVNLTNIGAKQPSAFLADTITVLSNSCLSAGIGTTISGAGSVTEKFSRGQINCMFSDDRAKLSNSTAQSRKATRTTVYAAFATNNEASCENLGSHADAAYCTERKARSARSETDTGFRSNESRYLGGAAHNFIRMLEQWTTNSSRTKVPFIYRGSMVNLGLPQEFNGLMVWDKVYIMPDRDWGYDLTFDSFDKLPPITPRVIYLKQDVFKRSY